MMPWIEFVCIMVSFVFITIYCDVIEHVFQKDTNRRYTNVSQTSGVTSALWCGRLCLRQDWCKHFSYNSLGQICELAYLTPGNSVQTDQEDGWKTYMYIESVDECKSSPCMNSGNCTDYTGYYECNCPDGWGGSRCDTITGCVSGTQMFGNSCYFIGESAQSQEDAQVNCTTFFPSAHLVDIKSKEEQKFIIDHINATNLDGRVWIGAKYIDSAGQYLWTDASSLNYTFWAPDEPNNGDEYCVAHNPSSGYKWIDVMCSLHYTSMCEYDIQ